MLSPTFFPPHPSEVHLQFFLENEHPVCTGSLQHEFAPSKQQGFVCSYPLEEHIDAFSNIISRCLSKLLQESVLGTKSAMYSSSFFCLESLINLKYMFLDCKGP